MSLYTKLHHMIGRSCVIAKATDSVITVMSLVIILHCMCKMVCYHSGCEASFQREMAILLPDFNIDGWYQHQEPLYRMGSVQFSEQSNTHILITPTPCLMQQQKQQEFAF